MTNVNLFVWLYLGAIIFVFINIWQLIIKDLINRHNLFYFLLIYLLNVGLSVFYFYYHNLIFSLIFSLFLMVASFLLILDLKEKLKRASFLTLPYFLLTIYFFAAVVNDFMLLNCQ